MPSHTDIHPDFKSEFDFDSAFFAFDSAFYLDFDFEIDFDFDYDFNFDFDFDFDYGFRMVRVAVSIPVTAPPLWRPSAPPPLAMGGTVGRASRIVGGKTSTLPWLTSFKRG